MPSPSPSRALTLLSCLALVSLGCRDKPEPKAKLQNVATAPPEDPVVEAPNEADYSGPKLVILIVVDQMRADYFERFDGQFEHGLARFHEQGRMYSQARHQHAMTETAPGHATISTGVPPSTHGIISNRWYDHAAGEKVNAVDDRGATILGNTDATGVSPNALLHDSVGDWMQAANPDSVVVSISLKDRAAILMGGKQPDAAIWYDDALGGYTSSTYYGEAAPKWVGAYNALDRAAALYGDKGWTLMFGPERYADSRAKTNPAIVTTFNDYALTKAFPHVIEVEGKLPRNVIRDTPFGDRMTIELARAAVENEDMGRDEVPDLLTLSMSGGDYAGHRYGPQSIEIHDYYLRLDEAIGYFLTELDNELGSDAYVAILTADHGVAPMPEYSEFPTAGRFIGKAEVPPMLAAAAKSAGLSDDQIPEFVYSHGPHLEFAPEIDEATRAKVRAELAVNARAHPLIDEAYTREELLGSEERNEFVRSWRRSFHPDRSPDVLFQHAKGVAFYPEGTGHGTPYDYDQHVPLIVLGVGEPEVIDKPVHTVDIAPTIAKLVEIEAPADLDGEALF